MKILPNIKYDGMEFECGGTIWKLQYINNEYYLGHIKDLVVTQPVEYSHIVKSLKNGFWVRITK